MGSHPRLIRPDELHGAIDLIALSFGMGPRSTPEGHARRAASIEPDRTFVVDDGDLITGTASSFSFDLALPGGTAPMAGVARVGVLPTHQRQGILSSLMDAVHDQALERGEPLAGLTASEGAIYRRFGYGVATRFQSVEFDTARADLVTESAAGVAGGTVRLIDAAEATRVLPLVWDGHWRRVPGEVSRTAGLWEAFSIAGAGRGGASARYVAVHETVGDPDGFVTYRVMQDWRDDGTHHELHVEAVAGADDVVARLLRFLAEIDLVATVRWDRAPLDLPWRWMLTDPRALATRAERDHLWLRLLDVARSLEARSYATEDSLVIEVVDTALPDVSGRYALEAGYGESECRRTDRSADLVVHAADLAALLLSGVRWATLQRAGLIDELVPGAVDRADALFRVSRAPFCATHF